jgi:hypothetical protein
MNPYGGAQAPPALYRPAAGLPRPRWIKCDRQRQSLEPKPRATTRAPGRASTSRFSAHSSRSRVGSAVTPSRLAWHSR